MNGVFSLNGSLSYMFEIKSRIRQCENNSPGYFNAFINDLSAKLRTSGYGCYTADMFCGCTLC